MPEQGKPSSDSQPQGLPGRTAWTRRLALGTVQFGLDYGVSNDTGQVSTRAACAILEQAHATGIRVLDTAAAYGNSEQVIGDCLQDRDTGFRIISKLPGSAGPENLPALARQSLARLGRTSIDGMLAHDFGAFQQPAYREALLGLKESGAVNGIGVSVYFPREVEWILEQRIALDLIQLPFSVLDQRFLPWLPALRDAGVEIHTRSVFLQGLFFLDQDTLNQRFPGAAGAVARVRTLAREHRLELNSLLLNFAIAQPAIDHVLAGVTSTRELAGNLQAFEQYAQCVELFPPLTQCGIGDENVLVPMNWST